MNIYNGVVRFDFSGEAAIEMPEWFGALNKDHGCQLTSVGGFGRVFLSEEVNNNRFRISASNGLAIPR